MLHVQPAGGADLERVLAIAAAGREAYAGYQPRFWRSATDAVARQRDYFACLIDDEEVLVAVVRKGLDVIGFAVARTVGAPPVYDPGGLTCLVDDCAVADPADWSTAGPLLVRSARVWGSARGATQLVVVVAHLDQPKRAMLSSAELEIASEWWVAPIPDVP